MSDPIKRIIKLKGYILYSYQRSSTDNCFDRLFDSESVEL